MRTLTVLLAALALAGCTSATDLVKALAKDNATACVSLDASLYGGGIFCRTNTPGGALIKATKGSVEIQHMGVGK